MSDRIRKPVRKPMRKPMNKLHTTPWHLLNNIVSNMSDEDIKNLASTNKHITNDIKWDVLYSKRYGDIKVPGLCKMLRNYKQVIGCYHFNDPFRPWIKYGFTKYGFVPSLMIKTNDMNTTEYERLRKWSMVHAPDQFKEWRETFTDFGRQLHIQMLESDPTKFDLSEQEHNEILYDYVAGNVISASLLRKWYADDPESFDDMFPDATVEEVIGDMARRI